MTPIIQNLLTAGFYGSVIIAAVLLLRLILKKAPKRVVCVLWMLAFIRLLMPFQLESKLSLQPEVVPLEETTLYEAVFEASPEYTEALNPNTPQNNTENITTDGIDGNIAEEKSFHEAEIETMKESTAPIHWTSVIPYFWLIGASAFLLYAVISYIRLKRTVREAVKIIGCWECDRIETAFILGYIRPRIYVPMGLSRRTRKHILAHEWAHLQTGDHWFKLLAYLACCLHWFNPLVWVAYRLMCKDMEHACDERVVRYMDLEARKQYSHALLTCSTNHSHYTPCPVAFGEVSVKSRILSVLNYRKPGFWITLIAVIAVAFVGVFLMTSPVEEEPVNDSDESLPAQTRVEVSTVDELLAAIAPNTEIILAEGDYDLSKAKGYGKTQADYYYWYQKHDGPELVIANVNNLTIRGSGQDKTTITAIPRYANVLCFNSCSDITVAQLTAGHEKEGGLCSGGVLEFRSANNVSVDRCGLYGCGIYGVIAYSVDTVSITDSEIYECSLGGVEMSNTNNITIKDCVFRDLGGPAYKFYNCYNLINENNVLPETEAPAPTSAITKLGLSYGGNGEPELKGHADEFTIASGQEVEFSLNYYPIDTPATVNDVKWSSSDNSVITIEGDNRTCTIKGVGVGTATATVELFGMMHSITVHVRESW